jgi:hypothetical protein
MMRGGHTRRWSAALGDLSGRCFSSPCPNRSPVRVRVRVPDSPSSSNDGRCTRAVPRADRRCGSPCVPPSSNRACARTACRRRYRSAPCPPTSDPSTVHRAWRRLQRLAQAIDLGQALVRLHLRRQSALRLIQEDRERANARFEAHRGSASPSTSRAADWSTLIGDAPAVETAVLDYVLDCRSLHCGPESPNAARKGTSPSRCASSQWRHTVLIPRDSGRYHAAIAAACPVAKLRVEVAAKGSAVAVVDTHVVGRVASVAARCAGRTVSACPAVASIRQALPARQEFGSELVTEGRQSHGSDPGHIRKRLRDERRQEFQERSTSPKLHLGENRLALVQTGTASSADRLIEPVRRKALLVPAMPRFVQDDHQTIDKVIRREPRRDANIRRNAAAKRMWRKIQSAAVEIETHDPKDLRCKALLPF